MNKNLIRVYGDSLSLPRCSENIDFLSTYPEILKKELSLKRNTEIYLYNRSKIRETITKARQAISDDNCYFHTGNGILIIQIGLCDCAPRPIPDKVRTKISDLPEFFKKKVISFLHKNRSSIQKVKYWNYTEKEIYRENYYNLLNEVSELFEYIFCINIPPTNSKIEEHSSGLTLNIENYNQIIEEVIGSLNKKNIHLIDVYAKAKAESDEKGFNKYVLKDGQHITEEGHLLYSRLILEKIIS